MPTETEIAYFAGLVDGEGSIGLVKNGNGHRGQLTIQMTTPDVLRWVKDKFGGNLHGPYVDGRPNHSPTWTWRILAARPLYRTLGMLRPHLKVKQQKADEVLFFLAEAPVSKTFQGVA